MSENKDFNTFPGGRGSEATFTQINLTDLGSSKKTFALIIEAYAKGDMSENQARALTYMLSNYLSYLKEEKTIDLELRLEILEAKI